MLDHPSKRKARHFRSSELVCCHGLCSAWYHGIQSIHVLEQQRGSDSLSCSRRFSWTGEPVLSSSIGPSLSSLARFMVIVVFRVCDRRYSLAISQAISSRALPKLSSSCKVLRTTKQSAFEDTNLHRIALNIPLHLQRPFASCHQLSLARPRPSQVSENDPMRTA